MDLTPRNLALALGACVLGGLAFGAVTTFAPSTSSAVPEPTSSPTSSVDLEGVDVVSNEVGDTAVTMPVASAVLTTSAPSTHATTAAPATSPAAEVSATPTATHAPSASASPSASATSATPSPTPTHTADASPKAKPSAAKPARPATPVTRPAPAPRPASKPVSRPASHAAAPKATHSINGWQPPALQRGANTITLPTLTSGSKVRIVVGCSPSTACIISGDQLVIGPDASSVTVTWSAAARDGYRSWQVSRALR